MAFRRLTYHRSWFMIVVGALGLASIVGNAPTLRWSPPENLAFAAIAGSAITLLMIVRGLTGQWGSRQLFVDVAAGTLRLPDGSVHALSELGALTIEKKVVSSPKHRTNIEYRLRAGNINYYL